MKRKSGLIWWDIPVMQFLSFGHPVQMVSRATALGRLHHLWFGAASEPRSYKAYRDWTTTHTLKEKLKETDTHKCKYAYEHLKDKKRMGERWERGQRGPLLGKRSTFLSSF